MQIYLPIAEMSVNVLVLLSIGGVVGFLSGMFGVGGGFLMTPLLIFMGVPSAIAVGTQANQLVAASVSGMVAHWRRGNVDLRMGLILLIGGTVGSFIGSWIFAWLNKLGQVDLLVGLSYVIFLGAIGGLMMLEAIRTILHNRKIAGGWTPPRPQRRKKRTWVQKFPLRMGFRKSRLYISIIPPLIIGFVVGIMSAIMGVGGGFIVLPAMIYILNMPTSLVIGTSLFQISVIMSLTTVLHSATNQSVDVVLALLLLVGSVIGAQFGTRVGEKLKGEQLRGLLAFMVLLVCIRMAYDLVSTPMDLYSITTVKSTM